MEVTVIGQAGSRSPWAKASMRFTLPATMPFIAAIQVASAKDTLRVRLLSIPHAKQAPSTTKAGKAPAKRASPGQLRTTAPVAMAAMPKAIRRLKLSLNTTQASNAVNTPSAFKSKAAPDAGMLFSPNINRTGPTIPPARIAPASQPASPRASRTGSACLIQRKSDSPMPEPR